MHSFAKTVSIYFFTGSFSVRSLVGDFLVHFYSGASSVHFLSGKRSMRSVAVAFSVASLTGPFYLAPFFKGKFHKLLLGTISQRFFAVLFFLRFCSELFRSAPLRGILRPALSQEPCVCSLLQRNFSCTFSQVIFPWVFLRGHSFLFRGSILPCSLSQRRCPGAHPRELFPCASLQWFFWFFACTLSQGLFPCVLLQGFFPCVLLHTFLCALNRATIPVRSFAWLFPWAPSLAYLA